MGAGADYYEHIAMFTGKGSEILSLQANFDKTAEGDPLVTTTVEAFWTAEGRSDSSVVVICPFPF